MEDAIQIAISFLKSAKEEKCAIHKQKNAKESNSLTGVQQSCASQSTTVRTGNVIPTADFILICVMRQNSAIMKQENARDRNKLLTLV